MNHTPTPWYATPFGTKAFSKVTECGTLRAAYHEKGGPENHEGLDLIHAVKCVNAHDELVAALHAIEDCVGTTPSVKEDLQAALRIASRALAKVQS